MKQKGKEHKSRENKKCCGESISQRWEIATLRIEKGCWEGDTVVGMRAGKEAFVFSILEKKTETYLAFRILGKTRDAEMDAKKALRCE